MASCRNKTLPINRERTWESCEHRFRVIAIPVVVEPVVAPVPRPVIPVQIPDVQVAVGVAMSIGYLPYHCPLNTLRAVSYSAS